MASQYFLKRDDQEAGPFGFRELIAFVREGKLVHSDQVRFSWTTQWQRADSLVGLFHMAQKAPERLTPPEDLRSPLAEEPIPAEPDEQVVISQTVDRPGWIMRLSDAVGLRKTRPGGIPILGPASATPSEASSVASEIGSDEPAASRAAARVPNNELPAELAGFLNQDSTAPGNRWSSTVDEALAAVESRGAKRTVKLRASRFQKMFGRLARIVPRGEVGQSMMRNGFRIVCAIACANLAAWAVDNWSVQEALRFPSRGAQVSSLRHFPVVGTCGSGEYLFLMFDLMLVAGVAAWFTAGWLESRAD